MITDVCVSCDSYRVPHVWCLSCHCEYDDGGDFENQGHQHHHAPATPDFVRVSPREMNRPSAPLFAAALEQVCSTCASFGVLRHIVLFRETEGL